MAFEMSNVTEHMGMFNSAESIEGHGWRTFTQGLVAAITRDMIALKQNVLDEAALQGPPGAPPVSVKHAEVFGHKNFRPNTFSGDATAR